MGRGREGSLLDKREVVGVLRVTCTVRMYVLVLCGWGNVIKRCAVSVLRRYEEHSSEICCLLRRRFRACAPSCNTSGLR